MIRSIFARLIQPLANLWLISHGMCNLLEIRRTCRRKGISIFKPVFIPKFIDNLVQPLFLKKKKTHEQIIGYWIIDGQYLEKTFQCSLVNKILKLIIIGYKICHILWQRNVRLLFNYLLCVWYFSSTTGPSISNSGKFFGKLAYLGYFTRVWMGAPR